MSALILLFVSIMNRPARAAEPIASPPPPFIHAFGAIDLFAPVGFENAQPDDDRFRVRAVELTLSAPLGKDLKGFINIATFDQDGTDDSGQFPGDFLFQLNEGYVSSATLVPNTFFRIGKFYLDVGILNGQHQIDWPFPSAPYYHQVFFDKNNVVDSGVEGVWSFCNHHFDIELGYTSGYDFGHANTNTGSKPVTPTSYVHPKWHSDSGLFNVGLNFLERVDSIGQATEISGYDLNYRTSSDKNAPGWLIQNETYYRYQSPSGVPLTEEVGGYFYAERDWNSKWSAGLRIDGYSETSLKDISGGHRSNLNYALVPVLDYRLNENTHLRAAYTYDVATQGGTSDVVTQIFQMQLIAEIGDIINLHE